MAAHNKANALSVMSYIVRAQTLLAEAQSKTKEIINSSPAIYPLAGDVNIDIETALEATHDAEIAAHLMFDGLQGDEQ